MTGTHETYIGLMTGTSADSIDAVGLGIDAAGAMHIAACASRPFAPELHQMLRAALAQPTQLTVPAMAELDHALGHALADAAIALTRTEALQQRPIRAIASHGQTLHHRVDRNPRYTLQIGDPNIIAARTGITTVADFRRRDVALGGEGAPLVPLFHQAAFANASAARVVVNIGGIANVTVLVPGAVLSGFDTGPGNTLMDAWCRHAGLGAYDEDGAGARTGHVHTPLLEALLQHPYFSRIAPKSTGPEQFNLDWVVTTMAGVAGAGSLSHPDMLATLCELTAVSICDVARTTFNTPGQTVAGRQAQLLVCGGGAHNATLLSRLRSLMDPVAVHTTDHVGIAPDWVEASAFAWLGSRTLAGLAGNCPSVTGANKGAVLGAVYPP